VTDQSAWEELDRVSEEVSKAWKPDKSAVEILLEGRGRGEMTAIMTEMPRDKLGMAIVKALGIDNRLVSRVIVDCRANRAPIVYIEAYGEEAMYDINWELFVKGAEVRLVWGEAKVE